MRILGFAVALAAGIVGTAGSAAKPVPKPVVVTPALTPENTLLLDLSTGGRVTIQLRPDKAPLSVARIKTLAGQGFYDGLLFHRVIEGFMAQTGDPQGTGLGGSQLPDLKAEFNDLPHVRGTTSMARAEAKDSANSQFFIMLSPNLKLDGKYSAFGRVVSGMAYVDAVQRGEPPANPSRIVKAWIASDPERATRVPAAAGVPAPATTVAVPPTADSSADPAAPASSKPGGLLGDEAVTESSGAKDPPKR
jgi:peptidylprolyl isomerase